MACYRALLVWCSQAMAASSGAQKVEVEADVDLGNIQEVAVPAGVFGDALEALEREKRGEAVGALGLFKRKKQATEDE
jgi:hypothetical protein